MRLLVLTREFPPHVIGGISYHLANLYSALAERGHEVTVLTGVSPAGTDAARDLVHDAITVHPVPYAGFTGGYVTLPVQLRRHLRDVAVDSFDVAVTHTPLPFGLSIPTVGKYHDCPQAERPFFRREQGPLERVADSLVNPIRRGVDRRSLERADHVIFNSELNREAWKNAYGVSVASSVLYNGVDTDVFAPAAGGRGEEYVLFVGEGPRKGVDDVLAYSKDGALPVYVVGDLSADVDDVRSLGRLEQTQLAELYAGAVATVHPAKFEAFGNVVLESLACGTPVVTSSACGASELLDEDCGVVDVPLATGIQRCRGLSADACVERAREHTWHRVAERTERTVKAELQTTNGT